VSRINCQRIKKLFKSPENAFTEKDILQIRKDLTLGFNEIVKQVLAAMPITFADLC
jgi:hypothetical protein